MSDAPAAPSDETLAVAPFGGAAQRAIESDPNGLPLAAPLHEHSSVHATGSIDPIGSASPVAPPAARRSIAFVSLLLLLACLPDAMLPPVLRTLVVERLGATEPQAHWFMAVNLVGALLALPLLAAFRRIVSPTWLIAIFAALNAALLLLLAGATNLPTALALRACEGAADMVVLAVLFDLFAKAGDGRGQGRRLGVASTVMMVGLAGGAILGGVLGRGIGEVEASAEHAPSMVLLVGASFCAALAVLTVGGRRLVRRTTAAASVHSATLEVPAPRSAGAPPLWTAAAMMGSDRMLAGLLTTTVPLLLASRLGWTSERIGGLLAVPLLIMAFGAFPAGLVADRFGALRTRTCAALVYAIALAAIPAAGTVSASAMLGTLLVLGLAAAALMPTSMQLAARSGRGAMAMGTCQAAGNIGYLLGIAGAGWMLFSLGGAKPSESTYAMVIVIFALAHVVTTGVTLVEAGRCGGRGLRPISGTQST